MNLDSETYLEVEEYDEFPPTYRLHGLGWSDVQDALAMKLNFFPELHGDALGKILGFMREHDIPTLQPASLKVEVMLMRAGVRII
jgi:hypothetical protein